MIFALDSNVVIHAMKGVGRVATRLARMSPTEIAIPAVVVYELEFGTLRSSDPERRQKELERLLGAISILPFDDRAASLAAKLRYDLGQIRYCHRSDRHFDSGNRFGPWGETDFAQYPGVRKGSGASD